MLPHLKKAFEGVNSLEFQKDIINGGKQRKRNRAIDYEHSQRKLLTLNDSGGCVEIWLDQIQTVMAKTVAHGMTYR